MTTSSLGYFFSSLARSGSVWMQLMQQSVQKSRTTILPRRSLSLSGPAVLSQATPPSSSGAGLPASSVSAPAGRRGPGRRPGRGRRTRHGGTADGVIDEQAGQEGGEEEGGKEPAADAGAAPGGRGRGSGPRTSSSLLQRDRTAGADEGRGCRPSPTAYCNSPDGERNTGDSDGRPYTRRWNGGGDSPQTRVRRGCLGTLARLAQDGRLDPPAQTLTVDSASSLRIASWRLSKTPSTPPQASANPTAVKPADAGRRAAKPLPRRQPPSPETTALRLRLLDGLLVGVVLLFAFLTALFPVYHSDFFLHAATGRLLAHGQYPLRRRSLRLHHNRRPTGSITAGSTTSSFTSSTNSSAAGGTILIVLKALMIAALAEVMLRTAPPAGPRLVDTRRLRRSGGAGDQSASAVAAGLRLLLLPRPDLLAAAACRGSGAPSRGRQDAAARPFLPYWLIPPLCLLWVNLDAWFLLGPATVALYLLGEALQDWLVPTREGPDSPTPGEHRTLLLVLIAAVAACLVNPLFLPGVYSAFRTGAFRGGRRSGPRRSVSRCCSFPPSTTDTSTPTSA